MRPGCWHANQAAQPDEVGRSADVVPSGTAGGVCRNLANMGLKMLPSDLLEANPNLSIL